MSPEPVNQPETQRLVERGRACYRAGDLEAALGCFQEALARRPDDPALHHALANAARGLGHMDHARDHYRRSIELAPSGLACYDLARIRRWRPDDEQTRWLLRQAKERLRSADDPERALLLFAQAKIHDDCGSYAEAFAHLREANAIQHRAAGIGIDALHSDVAVLEAFFDENRLRAAPPGCDSTKPLFVIGPPRSGTTLTERILTAHSRVSGLGERALVSELVAVPGRVLGRPAVFPDFLADANADDLVRLGQAYLARAEELASGAPDRIVDKMPDNAFLLGFIGMILPRASILNCRRHPLDVCLSIFFQSFAANRSYYCDLTELAEYYQLQARLERHWRQLLGEALLNVCYEELVERPERVVRRMLDHCGLPWEPGCLAFHAQTGTVRTASDWQVRQPLYASSRFRWRNYAEQLAGLRESLAEEIDRYEAGLAERLGTG